MALIAFGAFLAWPNEHSSSKSPQTQAKTIADQTVRPEPGDAPAVNAAAPVAPPREALTPEQKVDNVQDYFGTVFGSISLAAGLHDAVLGRIQMDMRAGELADARAYAHKLIDVIQTGQANVGGTAANLAENGDLSDDLIDDLDNTTNAVFGDMASSAAGIASMVDFGMGENASDMKDAQKHLKHLQDLMFLVYQTYGYAPAQVDKGTWRLKAGAMPTTRAASHPVSSRTSK